MKTNNATYWFGLILLSLATFCCEPVRAQSETDASESDVSETAADQLEVGDSAPDFTLTGNEDTEITLSQLVAQPSEPAGDSTDAASSGQNVILVFVRAHW